MKVCPKGLGKNIRLELSQQKDELGENVVNASTVAGAGTTITLQDMDDSASPQAGGLPGFDRASPFELLTGVLQLDDNSSVVTLPGGDDSDSDERGNLTAT